MFQAIRIKDPVEFQTSKGRTSGFVAAINGQKADVVTSSGDEYVVHLKILKRIKGIAPKRVFTSDQISRCAFCVNDSVFFYSKGKKFTGSIAQLNRTRARVKSGQDHWDVPYHMLNGPHSADRKNGNFEKLTIIAKQADQLLEQHGLDDWRFAYDHASKRAGSCKYQQKVITVADQFCFSAKEAEITDTILHEIAHALVGAEHGHNEVWQAKARQIGCSAERTHCVSFSAPRYIVSCKPCGTFGLREKRGKNRVCRQCLGPVTYEHYSEELWNSYRN